MRLLCSGRFQPEGTANFTVCKPPTSYSLRLYLRPSQPGNSGAASLSSSSSPAPSSPQGQSSLLRTPETIWNCTVPGAKIGAVLQGECDRGAETPPPQPVDRPLPRASGNLHCASAARVSTPGSADGAGEQSGSPPSPAPPRGQSLAGLKRKQMFSSFLALACDLQFSSVPT